MDEDGAPLHDGFAAYQGAVRAYSFTDDWYAPKRPAAAYVDLFEQARGQHVLVDPRDRGVEGIGHFGFFREVGREAGLWDEVVAWLMDRAEPTGPSRETEPVTD